MIKLEHTDVYGFDAAVRGMRNPLNSWVLSDSFECEHYEEFSDWCDVCEYEDCKYFVTEKDGKWFTVNCTAEHNFVIGEEDLKLMHRLALAGDDHGKFARFITVTVDITAPLYWWKEFDTYKIGTVSNSCSTMHKLMDKPFETSDFSWERVLQCCDPEEMEKFILFLDKLREIYIDFEALNKMGHLKGGISKKDVWYALIQLLPSSYNQRRTVQLNYQVLNRIVKARKNHKLDEWHVFCAWIEKLPYFKAIYGDK